MSNAKLDEALPPTTAGDLPSSLTYHQMEAALAETDIDMVKAQLIHVWAHYQALEFMLAGEALNIAATKETIKELHLEDVDLHDLTARVYSNGIILAAYEAAHLAGKIMFASGVPIGLALRTLFTDLDHVKTRDAKEAASATPEDFAV